LLGDLLYLVGDTRAVGVADDDEEDTGISSNSRVLLTIRAHVGDEPANKVLAALYIARSDTSIAVRQGALQVWKSVVSNSPKTLKEVIPQLLLQLVDKLSSESADLRLIASKALGDVVVKLGEYVLPIVVPHLQKGLEDGDQNKRVGVCMGLGEILGIAPRTQIESMLEYIVPTLQTALCDSTEEVRKLGATAFQTMFRNIGSGAINDVVSSLLEQVEAEIEDLESTEENDEDSQSLALLGLRELVSCRPRELLEFLLPVMLESPMSISSSRILGFVVSASGSQLNYQLSVIIPDIIPELADSVNEEDPSRHEAIKACAANIMAAVTTSGVNYLIDGNYIIVC
jgi:hypothetical protein